jgi:type IV secretion system protein VirB4
MLNFLNITKKKESLTNSNKEKSNQILFDSPGEEFIPFACHYNDSTILTKNGELVQTIRISGFSQEVLGRGQASLRDTIRHTVLENIGSNEFALYFHTIRKKVNLDKSPHFGSIFQSELHKSWVGKNSWNDKYRNELYVSVISSAKPIDLGIKSITKMFAAGYFVKEHNAFLEESSAKLNKMTDVLLETLSSYGASKLKIMPDNEKGYISELLEFFGNIIRLQRDKIIIDAKDLSKKLSSYRVAFGDDALEVKYGDKRFFATMLSLKNCSIVSNKSIDKFLQVPHQFVITQTMNFIDDKEYLSKHERQSYMFSISGDKEMAEKFGMKKALGNEAKEKNYFCETQVSMMVVAEDLKELERASKEVSEELFGIGIPVIKEDLNIEHCFWSQLPGNFTYIERKEPIVSKNIGSFASLYNFPFGSVRSKWGEYITLLKTNLGTAYFFNFHVGNNGHTIIVGDDNSGKKVLMNFLLSESSKLKTKNLYIGSSAESKLYIEAVGGVLKIFSFEAEKSSLKLNPLLLEDTRSNREYLKYWFLYLLDKYSDPSNIDEYSAAIEFAVSKVYELPREERKLSNIYKIFVDPKSTDLNKKIIKSLAQWHGKGKMAHVFDNDSDDLISDGTESFFAIDLLEIYDTPMSVNLPILNYLLYFFKAYYAGNSPSILTVSDGNRVFNSVYFEKNLPYILDDLEESNSLMLVTASFSSEKVNWSATVGGIYNQKMSTKIFLGDGSAFKNVNKMFALSGDERMYLESFDAGSREFVVRQGKDSIVSSMDIGEFEASLGILSNSKRYQKAVEGLKVKFGNAPNKWVPKIYELDI